MTCEEFCNTLVGEEFLEVAELSSMQEEENTRILHASRTANAGYFSVVNVSEDTDVLVLCIAFSSQIAFPMYQKTGTQAHTKYMNISQIANALGRDICMALLGMHALTGCDTVSAFAGRSKVSALKVARLLPAWRQTLKQLGDSWDLSDALFKSLQGFTCLLYSSRSPTTDVSDLLYKLFCAKKGEADSLQLLRVKHHFSSTACVLITKLVYADHA